MPSQGLYQVTDGRDSIADTAALDAAVAAAITAADATIETALAAAYAAAAKARLSTSHVASNHLCTAMHTPTAPAATGAATPSVGTELLPRHQHRHAAAIAADGAAVNKAAALAASQHGGCTKACHQGANECAAAEQVSPAGQPQHTRGRHCQLRAGEEPPTAAAAHQAAGTSSAVAAVVAAVADQAQDNMIPPAALPVCQQPPGLPLASASQAATLQLTTATAAVESAPAPASPLLYTPAAATHNPAMVTQVLTATAASAVPGLISLTKPQHGHVHAAAHSAPAAAAAAMGRAVASERSCLQRGARAVSLSGLDSTAAIVGLTSPMQTVSRPQDNQPGMGTASSAAAAAANHPQGMDELAACPWHPPLHVQTTTAAPPPAAAAAAAEEEVVAAATPVSYIVHAALQPCCSDGAIDLLSVDDHDESLATGNLEPPPPAACKATAAATGNRGEGGGLGPAAGLVWCQVQGPAAAADDDDDDDCTIDLVSDSDLDDQQLATPQTITVAKAGTAATPKLAAATADDADAFVIDLASDSDSDAEGPAAPTAAATAAVVTAAAPTAPALAPPPAGRLPASVSGNTEACPATTTAAAAVEPMAAAGPCTLPLSSRGSSRKRKSQQPKSLSDKLKRPRLLQQQQQQQQPARQSLHLSEVPAAIKHASPLAMITPSYCTTLLVPVRAWSRLAGSTDLGLMIRLGPDSLIRHYQEAARNSSLSTRACCSYLSSAVRVMQLTCVRELFMCKHCAADKQQQQQQAKDSPAAAQASDVSKVEDEDLHACCCPSCCSGHELLQQVIESLQQAKIDLLRRSPDVGAASVVADQQPQPQPQQQQARQQREQQPAHQSLSLQQVPAAVKSSADAITVNSLQIGRYLVPVRTWSRLAGSTDLSLMIRLGPDSLIRHYQETVTSGSMTSKGCCEYLGYVIRVMQFACVRELFMCELCAADKQQQQQVERPSLAAVAVTDAAASTPQSCSISCSNGGKLLQQVINSLQQARRDLPKHSPVGATAAGGGDDSSKKARVHSSYQPSTAAATAAPAICNAGTGFAEGELSKDAAGKPGVMPHVVAGSTATRGKFQCEHNMLSAGASGVPCAGGSPASPCPPLLSSLVAAAATPARQQQQQQHQHVLPPIPARHSLSIVELRQAWSELLPAQLAAGCRRNALSNNMAPFTLWSKACGGATDVAMLLRQGPDQFIRDRRAAVARGKLGKRSFQIYMCAAERSLRLTCVQELFMCRACAAAAAQEQDEDGEPVGSADVESGTFTGCGSSACQVGRSQLAAVAEGLRNARQVM